MTRRRRPRSRLQNKIRKQMRGCCLYRWDSQTEPGAEDFKVYGPYDEEMNFSLMEQAVTTNRKWFCVITAYFIDGKNDYYEEVLTFPPFGPLKFNEDPDAMLDIIDAGIAEAKQSGNPKHYRDTCVALYLHTPELEKGFEDDDWVKQQAGHRADIILDDSRRTG
jgi:hypothetical protein